MMGGQSELKASVPPFDRIVLEIAFPKLCSVSFFKVFPEFLQSLTFLLPNSQNANADRLPNLQKDWKVF